ncbi:hypothetical protein ARAM_004127 [Aspergillus rambellii]|uniref:Uncharacterized protein n=2 Tax=Aspergillus subgen. Nidulantes TaxID=2720870 RepID=A0A0F8XDE6_9EURO|nr:hypothetical protein ARAM_004127 [Aspergillus rambellii]KKK24073.1 hypothetical protein AOCH_005871 [Aspergillus ochraceoroseus]
MPTSSNTSSPVKRPGLARRAVSSHAVVTRSSSSQGDLSLSNSSHTQRTLHRPHRPHVVGGHRSHGRNPSFGKNLNKLHQRKKSAPVTPAASPPRGSHNHVRWDGAVDGTNNTTASMRKNYSSPALRRNTSTGVITKKALVTDRPQTGAGKKKSVGFELVDSDNDDGDWEDTTQSPESTRRGSVVQSKDSEENQEVLVDPLTFVKRSYPQFPRATSLPESTSRSFHDDDSSEEDHDHDSDHNPQPQQSSDSDEHRGDTERTSDHSDIASRLLSPSHSAKAPPAMSSISATAAPAPVDTISRNASLTNLASGHDSLRRPLSSANVAQALIPGSQTHATSSSIEGGVSRFIKTGTSRTDSDPNTPSSFLPHYHPQTPPSPKREALLQRTAALNTSPPDSHGVPASASPSAMDPTYISGTPRTGSGPFDAARALMNGASRNGGVMHQHETKHIRKAYEKTAMELTVVRRFQSPTGDSLNRLNAILKNTKASNPNPESRGALIHSAMSAPALFLLQDGKRQTGESENVNTSESRQLVSRRQPDMQGSVSQTYFQDPEDLVNDSADSTAQHQGSQHPSQRLLSTSDEAAPGNSTVDEEPEVSLLPNEAEMMIRRMWESREVATSG